jgi:hypothetical protein
MASSVRAPGLRDNRNIADRVMLAVSWSRNMKLGNPRVPCFDAAEVTAIGEAPVGPSAPGAFIDAEFSAP